MADSETRWIRRRWNGIGGRRNLGGGSSDQPASTPCRGWKFRGGDPGGAAVSARKLAASLWKLTASTSGGSGNVRWWYVLFDRHNQFEFSTEETTKWDFCNSKDVSYASGRHFKKPDTMASAELGKAQKGLMELETKRNRLREKVEHRTKNVDHERKSWMMNTRTEHHSLVDGVKMERRKCKEMSIVNSKLMLDIAEAKISSKKLTANLEEEKKARKLLEDSCNYLAKEIKGNRAEIVALRNQRKIVQDEVEQERKMLQLAEVWREEQAQMKLVDAKLIFEEKLVEINRLIADLESFLRNANLTTHPKFPSQVFDSFEQPESSEISSQPLKRQLRISSAVKFKTALSRNKDTCKKILTDKNPHVDRAMKGRIEWPREIRPEGLAGNLLEAKFESQKMLVRNVLKQRS